MRYSVMIITARFRPTGNKCAHILVLKTLLSGTWFFKHNLLLCLCIRDLEVSNVDCFPPVWKLFISAIAWILLFNPFIGRFPLKV